MEGLGAARDGRLVMGMCWCARAELGPLGTDVPRGSLLAPTLGHFHPEWPDHPWCSWFPGPCVDRVVTGQKAPRSPTRAGSPKQVATGASDCVCAGPVLCAQGLPRTCPPGKASRAQPLPWRGGCESPVCSGLPVTCSLARERSLWCGSGARTGHV